MWGMQQLFSSLHIQVHQLFFFSLLLFIMFVVGVKTDRLPQEMFIFSLIMVFV